MRWIWIDRFLEFEHGKSARALKNLSLAEDHFADHFPGYPVMPGALILEGLAQTGGILIGEANDFKEKVVLAKINWARFHRDALAGEQLIYDVTILNLRPEGAAIEGKVTSPGRFSARSRANVWSMREVILYESRKRLPQSHRVTEKGSSLVQRKDRRAGAWRHVDGRREATRVTALGSKRER